MRRWHKPIALSKLNSAHVPDNPGVFVLLEDEARLNSVLKIASARSLKAAFLRELDPAPEDYMTARAAAMMYFETWSDVAEAERLLNEYRRRNGRNPVLNSPY